MSALGLGRVKTQGVKNTSILFSNLSVLASHGKATRNWRCRYSQIPLRERTFVVLYGSKGINPGKKQEM